MERLDCFNLNAQNSKTKKDKIQSLSKNYYPNVPPQFFICNVSSDLVPPYRLFLFKNTGQKIVENLGIRATRGKNPRLKMYPKFGQSINLENFGRTFV